MSKFAVDETPYVVLCSQQGASHANPLGAPDFKVVIGPFATYADAEDILMYNSCLMHEVLPLTSPMS